MVLLGGFRLEMEKEKDGRVRMDALALRVFIASSFKRKDVTVQEGRRLSRRPVAERLYIDRLA